MWILRWCDSSETTSSYPTDKAHLTHSCVLERLKIKNYSKQSVVIMEVLTVPAVKRMLWRECPEHLATEIHCLSHEQLLIFRVSAAPASALLTNAMFGVEYLMQIM